MAEEEYVPLSVLAQEWGIDKRMGHICSIEIGGSHPLYRLPIDGL
jgi:hypothetical protein